MVLISADKTGNTLAMLADTIDRSSSALMLSTSSDKGAERLLEMASTAALKSSTEVIALPSSEQLLVIFSELADNCVLTLLPCVTSVCKSAVSADAAWVVFVISGKTSRLKITGKVNLPRNLVNLNILALLQKSHCPDKMTGAQSRCPITAFANCWARFSLKVN